jgi:hypothetical protein
VSGQILAEGTDGRDRDAYQDGGGGAGGSLWLVVQTLNSGDSNPGYISASGGEGYGPGNESAYGGGGGGGLIVIDAAEDNFTGAVLAAGGAGGGTTPAEAGNVSRD